MKWLSHEGKLYIDPEFQLLLQHVKILEVITATFTTRKKKALKTENQGLFLDSSGNRGHRINDHPKT